MNSGKINNNKISYNAQSSTKTPDNRKNIQNTPAATDTAAVPNNPQYWQAKTGISSGLKDANKSSLINKCAAKLYYHRQMLSKPYIEFDREMYKAGLRSLLPYGCKAMSNYKMLVNHGFTMLEALWTHYSTHKEVQERNIIASDAAILTPEIFNEEEYYKKASDIFTLLAYAWPKNINDGQFDIRREIIREILANKDASTEDKLWWLENVTTKNIHGKDNLEEYKKTAINNFINFAKTDSETEKLNAFLKDFDIDEYTINKITELVQNDTISKDDIVDATRTLNEEDYTENCLNENLSKISNAIHNKPVLGKHLRNITTKPDGRNIIGCNTTGLKLDYIAREFSRNDERIDFEIQVLDFIAKNWNDKYSLFDDEKDYKRLINSLNKDNFQEFKDLYEKDGFNLRNAINIAKYCHDKDSNTGEFKLYPGQKECLKSTLNALRAAYTCREMTPAISSKYVKKDKDGNYYYDREEFYSKINAINKFPKIHALSCSTGIENCASLLTGEDSGINKLNLKDILKTYKILLDAKDELKELPEYRTTFSFLDKALSDIEFRLNSDNIFLPVEDKHIKNFAANVLTSKNEGLSNFEKTINNSIPLLKSYSEGLALEYSRKEFLEDLSNICNNREKLEILSSKTGITPIENKNGEISIVNGYDGIMFLDKLNKNNPLEAEIYKLAHRFFYENTINTGNEDLDNYLNIIIKTFPEFINMIGKKQHSTHSYTLDIHSLLVLANSINNPRYQSLKPVDKAMLKCAALFHDISKAQEKVDEEHQILSAMYSNGILKKVIKNPESRERFVEFINNHHWLKEYQTAEKKDEAAKEIAFKFRRNGDFDIANIVAQADLMSVNEKFYEEHKNALNDENLEKIKNNIKKINSTGCAIFSDYFIAPKKLDNYIQNYKGKNYKVINFHSILADESLEKYGFIKKSCKKDVNFLVHMVNDKKSRESLETVKRLASSVNKGCLSVSLIKPEHARTYQDRKYGVMLSTINDNVINVYQENQSSGNGKGMADILELLYNTQITRNNFRENILKNLGIKNVTDEEYEEFYREVLAQKTTLEQIPAKKEYTLGNKTFSGAMLTDAIKQFQNFLIDENNKIHNEIVCYTPKIQAVIAKAKSLSKIPDDVLDFAYKNNLPIVLI